MAITYDFGSITSTATYNPGRYVYDEEMTSGATILRVLEGIIEVSPNATK